MSKQTILITGATDGIGKLAAIDLAKNKDNTILIHGRDKVKLDKVVEEIKQTTGNQNIEGYVADMSSLNEVRRLANDVLSSHEKIHVLINNAGAGFVAPRYGKDGTETRFTV